MGWLLISGCPGVLDIVFLLDKSGSIRQEKFGNILRTAADIIYALEISNQKTRVGAISFGANPTTEFYLDTFTSAQDMARQILHIQYRTGHQTNIASAMRHARNNLFTSQRGDRAEAPNVIIIISDGIATVEVNAISRLAVELKTAGTRIMTISMGTSTAKQVRVVDSLAPRRSGYTVIPLI